MILYALIYFLNGISLAFFITAGMRMFFYARRTGSRPHLLFAICLGWMALIQVKEFFCNFIPFYNYEVLGPAFTFPDLFTLPLLSLFFFELVMPGRINLRYALRLLAPFALLGSTYLVGLFFFDRTIYLSLGEVIDDLPALLPATLLLYVVYAAGYCIFAFIRIVRFSLLYTEQIAQAYSFTERIHLRWMRWMAGILAFYLISYIGIIAFTTSENYIVFTFALSLAVWGVLYGCVIQYRIPKIILNYWRSQSAREQQPEENVSEKNERIEALRAQVAEAIDTRRLYLNPGLTIVDMAAECGTNRTHLSQFFNNELGLSFRDYINRCRVEHAVRLMAEHNYKIEELALLAGFGSTTTFYRAFAKEKGETPQRWQEQHAQSKAQPAESTALPGAETQAAGKGRCRSHGRIAGPPPIRSGLPRSSSRLSRRAARPASILTARPIPRPIHAAGSTSLPDPTAPPGSPVLPFRPTRPPDCHCRTTAAKLPPPNCRRQTATAKLPLPGNFSPSPAIRPTGASVASKGALRNKLENFFGFLSFIFIFVSVSGRQDHDTKGTDRRTGHAHVRDTGHQGGAHG